MVLFAKDIKFADVNPGFHKGPLKLSDMRNFIVLFAFLVLASVTMLAQDIVEKPVEINVSYGGPHGTIGMVGGAHTTFSAMLEVKYTPAKWISIGVVGGLHDHSRGASLPPLQEGEPDPGTSYECNFMLNVYGNWLTRKHLRLYSGIGYGTIGGYVKGDGHPSHGFQLIPIGVSYGRTVYGFAELGMGWMYTPARAGIGIRF